MGTLVVLIVVSAFGVWSSRVMHDSAQRAVQASKVSDDFARAVEAVVAEESFERQYRLDPGPGVMARYEAAQTELVEALADAAHDGDDTDRAIVDAVMVEHTAYAAAVTRIFATVGPHRVTEMLRTDADEVNVTFRAMESAVDDRADLLHEDALGHLADLQGLERSTRQLAPVVFLLGVALAGILVTVARRYARMVASETDRATLVSQRDALTGLPNRSVLASCVDAALGGGPAGRDGDVAPAVALLLIDLDRFKEVNDTLGHRIGDGLLCLIGPRLRTVLREGDMVARLGGDEFAVLLEDVPDQTYAVGVADRLRCALEAPFDVDGIAIDVEGSVGIALGGVHGDDATALLQRADVAMYVAKKQHAGVFVYDVEQDGNTPARLALLGDLRRALEQSELVLHYQPKVAAQTGALLGAEALVRWQHPTRGLVLPDDFIPLAERTGLIGPLTEWVLNEAMAQARRWADEGSPLTVSVNLSARSLTDLRLPDQVAEILATHGVPASMLLLEVTESAIMLEPALARELLDRLAGLGVQLSIDDFGAGYTSLGQLKMLPVSELKIDRSFVMGMLDDASDALIVRSIVELGHNLGMTIVAEGVEDGEVLRLLASFGCDVAQGYHFSRPVPVGAFDAWRRECAPAVDERRPAATRVPSR